MEQITDDLNRILKELSEIKIQLELYDTQKNFDNWIPRKKIMTFFNYEDTQVADLLKNEDIQVAQIGNRKFVKKESIIRFLEKNIKK